MPTPEKYLEAAIKAGSRFAFPGDSRISIGTIAQDSMWNSTVKYTCPQDGYICIASGKQATGFFIEGAGRITYYRHSEPGSYWESFGPFVKGETLKISVNSLQSTSTVMFIPVKGGL